MIFLKFIAHRGLRSEKVSENTIASFKNAIKNDHFAGFEFDVRKTKDNQYIVNHNAFIKEDLICTKTVKELKTEYNLPTLEEVLKLKTEKMLFIEVKDPVIDYDTFIKIINKYAYKNIYIMSFHNVVIEKLQTKHIKAKLGVLNYILNSTSDYPFDFICLLDTFSTKSLVEKYQKNKVQVVIYGILNTKKDLRFPDTYYIVDYPITKEK